MKVTVKKFTARDSNENGRESAVDRQEQISRRAYEIYERRGREAGHEVEDWLQAEAELARERSLSLAAGVAKVRKSQSQALAKEKASRVKKKKSSVRRKSEEEATNGN